MFRRRKAAPGHPEPDVSHVPARYRRFVDDAHDVRRRYQSVTERLEPGPLRDRMAATGERLDAAVAAIVATVFRAAEIAQLVAGLDAERTTTELKRARRNGDDPALVEALAQRFESTQRLLNALEDTEDRLRVLDARLGAAVARAAEIAVVGGPDAVGGHAASVDTDLDAVVLELEALRLGLDAVR